MKPFSILHISDLHRSPNSQISNSELISALIEDRIRYRNETPQISDPQAIVVCGDIIQGVPLETPDFEKQLTQQYDIAAHFLDELTNRFLGGDRSRLIIVPGNHDVDWNTAYNAFEIVDPTDIKINSSMLCYDQSDYRLSLDPLILYRIANRELYELRLKEFWKFYAKFYDGVSGLVSDQVNEDFNLFSLFDGRIGLAAFNSCHNNDCFAFHGHIRREAVAQSYLRFVDSGHAFDLCIAAWHHSIEGSPYQTDYMDIDVVRGMIGRGFRIGLYGHQHKSQVTPHHIWLTNREKMAVISAGSLCADPGSLPMGIKRQYNVLEISPDLRRVRVHVRSMEVANLFSKSNLHDFGGASYADLDWEPMTNLFGDAIDTTVIRERNIVEKAEIAAKSGNHAYAVELLKGVNPIAGSYGHHLLITTASDANDWQTVLSETTNPMSNDELIKRVDAFIRLQRFSCASDTLEAYHKKVQLAENIVDELRKRIKIEEAIRR